MNRLTHEQALILTGFTGVLMCDFSSYHEDIEKRLGHPVWTHQIPALTETIQEAYREDFMKLIPELK